MTNFNYDLFKVSKINNFLWFFFMVKNCYKFSKMGFLVVFNVFLIIKFHYFFQNEIFSGVHFLLFSQMGFLVV